MKYILIIFLLNILFANYGAGYAGSGFRYGSNAREFSLAGAIIADKTSGFYAFSNPALIQFTTNNSFGISFQKMSLDRSIQVVSFSRKIPPNAGIGASFFQSRTDNIIGRDEMNNHTEEFSSKEIEGIISFGLKFSDLAVGINIKLLSSNIGKNNNANGIAGDLGLIYKYNNRLYFGALIENMKASYSWKVIIDQDERAYEEKIPQFFSLGFVYNIKRWISLFLQQDIILLPNDNVNYRSRLGIEYKLKNKLNFRGGLNQLKGTSLKGAKREKFNLKPTIGAGIPIQIWNKHYLQFDYAFDIGIVDEGFSHLFSFSLEY